MRRREAWAGGRAGRASPATTVPAGESGRLGPKGGRTIICWKIITIYMVCKNNGTKNWGPDDEGEMLCRVPLEGRGMGNGVYGIWNLVIQHN